MAFLARWDMCGETAAYGHEARVIALMGRCVYFFTPGTSMIKNTLEALRSTPSRVTPTCFFIEYGTKHLIQIHSARGSGFVSILQKGGNEFKLFKVMSQGLFAFIG